MPSSRDFRPIASDAFKTWGKCRRKFYYKWVKTLQWPEDQSNFKLGKDVHKLLDYQARGLDCSRLVAEADEKVQNSWRKLMDHPITRLPILGNEWGFHVPVAGRWVVGRIDRIARDGNRILLIDWKTGTGVPRNPEGDWQTVLYLYALVETARTPSASDLGLDGLQPEDVCFVYVEVKPDANTPIREVEVPYDSQKHETAKARIEKTLSDMLNAQDYPLPERCPDRYCGYRTICGIEG